LKEKLNFEAFYPHPPERVWQALTDPTEIRKWLMPAEFEAKVGFRFRFDGQSLRVAGEVLEVSEARRLRYTWDDGESGSPSVVSWLLEPKDGGTLLRLEHQSSVEESSYVLIEAYANWPRALGRMLQPVPIVYDDLEEVEPILSRAGFRQERPVKQSVEGGVTCR
jgi:uncharacterized protein YndB with AHSA1/START domain